MLICKFRRGPTWFLTSTLRRLGIVLEFWRGDQFRLHEEFHYHIKFGTSLWGMCRSQFWEHKLYLYYMITKIVISWGGNLIIILHDLWRMAPFYSQSAPLRDLHQGCISGFYTASYHSMHWFLYYQILWEVSEKIKVMFN